MVFRVTPFLVLLVFLVVLVFPCSFLLLIFLVLVLVFLVFMLVFMFVFVLLFLLRLHFFVPEKNKQQKCQQTTELSTTEMSTNNRTVNKQQNCQHTTIHLFPLEESNRATTQNTLSFNQS